MGHRDKALSVDAVAGDGREGRCGADGLEAVIFYFHNAAERKRRQTRGERLRERVNRMDGENGGELTRGMSRKLGGVRQEASAE